MRTRIRVERHRWARGYYYGWPRPSWWPKRLGYRFGFVGTYDGQKVTLFAGGQRREFAPTKLGRYRGHQYDGVLQPDAAEVAARLRRVDRPVAAAPALAAVSGFEGGFDSLQTYGRAKLAWGFVQFTALGGLPRLLTELARDVPDAFARHLGTVGVGVDKGLLVVRRGGRRFVGRRALDVVHDEPQIWSAFLALSHEESVRDVQVRNAYDYFYAWPARAEVLVGGQPTSLEALLGEDPVARAVLFDRAVRWGVVAAVDLFRAAASAVGRGGPNAVVDYVRSRAIGADRARVDAVMALLAGPPPES